ncbi:MAG: endonuclease/exonuclease/phosphatase family protein [Caldilineaceae bacterium]|nr:endonuclease/exonuclease/phosphatase family protein [Caldilineaceae bacterium]
MRIYRPVAQLIDVPAALLSAVILTLSIGGYAADWHWRLAWYSNPRPHFVVAALLAGLWFLLRRQRWGMAATLVTLLLNGLALAPIFLPQHQAVTPDNESTFTLVHLNTDQGAATLSPLLTTGADLLLLQEVTPALAATLPQTLPDYTIIQSHPLTNTHGSATLLRKGSSLSVVGTETILLPAYATRPLLTAQLELHGHRIRLLNFHLTRPDDAWRDGFQQVELTTAAAWSRTRQQAERTEVIIAGDFNVTPWSTRFVRLLQTGDLQDSLRGFGLQNSWPTDLPLVAGIPIDHALHSAGMVTLDRKILPTTGSDHAALLVTFAFVE